ncbi:hypothetical protein EVAR_92224_1 [Eumeta japonica]|uniref:Biogenesis of lysosome-related organelles complex 1 subunit 4 n=1 Tax=Eumeta variegata TaxID=151549 RepID=A0A4C1TN73_EUMVA|nr:hypothetical protein EVAR_92224_1 [Eumeta japonica]
MLAETIVDYSDYLKLDLSSEMKRTQDIIDNMLTRLEELASVLQMIKVKNSDCNSLVTEDIGKHRSEMTVLFKKINTLNLVIAKISSNIDSIEKQVEKAESHFGVSNDNRIKNLLMPFWKRNKEIVDSVPSTTTDQHFKLCSVLEHFEDKTSQQ